jgi:hypothetical protein
MPSRMRLWHEILEMLLQWKMCSPLESMVEPHRHVGKLDGGKMSRKSFCLREMRKRLLGCQWEGTLGAMAMSG